MFLEDNEEFNALCDANDNGPQGHFKFTKLDSGAYHITTKKWPEVYFYMQNVGATHYKSANNCRGWKGAPGP